MNAFIERNNQWTVGQETIVGKVYVGFVVEVDGTITNIEIMKSLHETCDLEAIRIVKLMPKWQPGKFNDVIVPTKMVLPIAFEGLK